MNVLCFHLDLNQIFYYLNYFLKTFVQPAHLYQEIGSLWIFRPKTLLFSPLKRKTDVQFHTNQSKYPQTLTTDRPWKY